MTELMFPPTAPRHCEFREAIQGNEERLDCVVAGDGGCEAYTVIMWGVLLSLENQNSAEVETVCDVKANMCGPVMRGADALPWSKTTSRTKRSCRNLGDLTFERWHNAPKVSIGKA